MFFLPHPLAIGTLARLWGKAHGPGLLPRMEAFRPGALKKALNIPEDSTPILPEIEGLLALAGWLKGEEPTASGPTRIRQARALWQLANLMARYEKTAEDIRSAAPANLSVFWQNNAQLMLSAMAFLAEETTRTGTQLPGTAEATFWHTAKGKGLGVEATWLGLELQPLTPAQQALVTSTNWPQKTWEETLASLTPPAETTHTIAACPTPQQEMLTAALAIRQAWEEGQTPIAIVTEDPLALAALEHHLARWNMAPTYPTGKRFTGTAAGRWWNALAMALQEPSAVTLAALLGLTENPTLAEPFAALESLLWRGPTLEETMPAWEETLHIRMANPYTPERLAQKAEEGWAVLASIWPQTQKPQPLATWATLLQNLAETLGAPAEENGGTSIQTLLQGYNQNSSPRLLESAEMGALLADNLSHLRLLHTGGTEGLVALGVPEAAAMLPPTRILLGTTEDTWPRLTPNPWLNDEQLARLGLPTQGTQARQGALYWNLLWNNPGHVVATYSTTSEGGSETRPTRFLPHNPEAKQRGEALLALTPHLHTHPTPHVPSKAANITPPGGTLPTTWSATHLQNLLGCPFRAVLEKPLRPGTLATFNEPPESATLGTLLHTWVESFWQTPEGFPHLTPWPHGSVTPSTQQQATAHLLGLGRQLLEGTGPQLRAVAWARMQNLAPEITKEWAKLTAAGYTKYAVEEKMHTSWGSIQTFAKADALWQHTTGTLLLVDYKTGTPPDWPKVAKGTYPQLPLEAAMLNKKNKPVSGIAYWHLKGREETPLPISIPGPKTPLETLVAPVEPSLKKLAETYTENKPHPACPEGAEEDSFTRTICTYCPLEGVCRKKEWAA